MTRDLLVIRRILGRLAVID